MLTTYTPYTNPGLDAYCKNTIREATDKAHIAGQTTGSTNQPPLTGGSIEILFQSFHLEFQMILDHINKVLQAEGTRFSVQENGAQVAQEKQKLNNQLAEKRAKCIPVESRFNSMPMPKKFSIWKATIAIAIIGLTDALFSRQVFEWWLGVSYLEALLYSLVFAGAFTIYAHTARYLIALGKTINQRRILIAVVFLAAILWFYYMGWARASYMNTVEESIRHSPLPFTVMSTILMGIAVMIAWRSFPSKEEREAMDRYNAVKAEKEQMEADIQATKDAITKLDEDNTRLRTNSAAVFEYAAMLEQEVLVAAEKAYYELQNINIRYRTDGGQPDCFGKSYPFTFKQYFLFNNNQ